MAHSVAVLIRLSAVSFVTLASSTTVLDGGHSGSHNRIRPTTFGERIEALEMLVAKQQEEIVLLGRKVQQQNTVTSQLSSHVEEQDKTILTLRRQLTHYDVITKVLFRQQTAITTKTTPTGQHPLGFVAGSDDRNKIINIDVNRISSDRILSGLKNNIVINNTATPDESREVKARSDDLAPLEVVVNQLSQHVIQLEADVQNLRNSNTQRDVSIQDARSSIYVRWGHYQCPGSSQLVYSGVMGGGSYTDSGSGVNNLCLTLHPVFGEHRVYYSFLYGTEFETWDGVHQDKDPVCAVCRTSFTSTIMIPGTNACTTGWTLQYNGYLMGGHNNDPAASEFICVDSAMESRIGGDASTQGKLLFYTASKCGTLPCGPYAADQTVLCAVCSM